MYLKYRKNNFQMLLKAEIYTHSKGMKFNTSKSSDLTGHIVPVPLLFI